MSHSLFPDVTTAELAQRAARVLTPNYRPAPIVFVRGEGARLFDRDGRAYLDMVGGIAVNSLGQGHPRLARVIQHQAETLIHVSNLWLNEPVIALAEWFVSHTFADRVFFANSGAEANEAALKLARRYQTVVRKAPEKTGVLAFHHSFHGRTMGALSVTGQPKYHAGFEPLVPGAVFADFGDLASVERLLDAEGGKVGTIIVEPIQCEGGVNIPPPGFLQGLRQSANRRDIVLIFDEVQTGVGRTGTWFAYEQADMRPDILTTAKGIAGGVPLGVMVAIESVAAGFQPGSHASTFGGNALATRAGLEVVRVIEDEGLLDHARILGKRLGAGLQGLVQKFPLLCQAQRGIGLIQALELRATATATADQIATQVIEKTRQRGLLLSQVQGRTLRLVPPLVVTEAEVDAAVALLAGVLDELGG